MVPSFSEPMSLSFQHLPGACAQIFKMKVSASDSRVIRVKTKTHADGAVWWWHACKVSQTKWWCSFEITLSFCWWAETGSQSGPEQALTCPETNWHVLSVLSSLQHEDALPVIHYQAVLLTFLGILCLMVFFCCIWNHLSEKKAKAKGSGEANLQMPHWARRKSSAYQSAIYMQPWDLEKPPFESESRGRNSISELQISISTNCNTKITDMAKVDFRAAIDSVVQLQPEDTVVIGRDRENGTKRWQNNQNSHTVERPIRDMRHI